MDPLSLQGSLAMLSGVVLALQLFIARRKESQALFTLLTTPHSHALLPSPPFHQDAHTSLLLDAIHAQMRAHLMHIVSERGSALNVGSWYVKPRSLHWWNHYVFFVREDDERFRSVFRLPLVLFDHVCSLLRDQLQQGPIPEPFTHIEGRVLPVEKQVAIAVMRLATGASMMTLSEIFGLGKSTIVESINKFVKAMLQHQDQYISFPRTAIELERVKQGFREKRGFPNVCGAIDATHIILEKPVGESALDWFDRNKHYSMLVQGIVDSEMRFLDVFAGWPGSTNDTRLLKNSSFHQCVESGILLNGPHFVDGSFSMREYIIADGGYPLLDWLMRPYDKPSTPLERRYNFKLSSTRIVVERAFGRLKIRWCYLHNKVCNPKPANLAKAITVCCMLHNMTLGMDDDEDDDMEANEGDRPEECTDVASSTTEDVRFALATYVCSHPAGLAVFTVLGGLALWVFSSYTLHVLLMWSRLPFCL